MFKGRERWAASNPRDPAAGRTPSAVLDLVRDLRAVENRESNDAGSLLPVSNRHLTDHDVFLGNDPAHVEAPAAGARRIPRLNRCEVLSPDDALARARPVDLAVLREVTGRTVPVILLHGSPERLDSGATRHDREHRAATAHVAGCSPGPVFRNTPERREWWAVTPRLRFRNKPQETKGRMILAASTVAIVAVAAVVIVALIGSCTSSLAADDSDGQSLEHVKWYALAWASVPESP